jgi:hypothetical protein
MNKNNTFKLSRSIAQLVPFHLPLKKEERRQTTKRDIHNKVGNNNGNNSDSKYSVLSIDLYIFYLKQTLRFRASLNFLKNQPL